MLFILKNLQLEPNDKVFQDMRTTTTNYENDALFVFISFSFQKKYKSNHLYLELRNDQDYIFNDIHK